MAKHTTKRFSPYKFISVVLSAGLAALILGLVLKRSSFPVLQAAGPIARGEQQLMLKAFLLMLIVVIPVFVLTFYFAWRYRETNKKATYKPDWDRNRLAETVWWAVPTMLIFALSIMTWHSSHQFDPYKSLAGSKELRVQVVALDWRWLFIYPDLRVASLNELHIPVNTPVRFDITSDAPMNSFWIPQLGGQMYAMPGMTTRLHLEATKPGSYYGESANISGAGFARMHFMAVASSSTSFNAWTQQAAKQQPLTQSLYDKIAQQNSDHSVVTYGQPTSTIFSGVVAKYSPLGHSMHMEQN